MTPAERIARATRVEQGLPEHVQDPAALARVAALIDPPTPTTRQAATHRAA